MNRTFRILILDDDVMLYAPDAIRNNREFNWSQVQCQAVDDLLRYNKEELNVEVFVSGDANMSDVFSVTSKETLSYGDRESLRAFIKTLDVLILDIGGVKKKYSDEFQESVKRNFRRIGKPSAVPAIGLGVEESNDGIEFFHIHLDSFSKNALIAVLTVFDRKSDAVLNAYLNDFTVQDFKSAGENKKGERIEEIGPDLPYVVKFGKTATAGNHLTDLILAHYDFFKSGLSDSTNRFHISFAASHDRPVMIVGESGTGKEHIAKFIHKQWTRRKKRACPDLVDKVGRFQVVNCGGLSEKLAQAELFGYIRGSFTGANEHRLGKVFIAAGIDPLGKSSLTSGKNNSYSQAEADIKRLNDGFAALEKAPQEKKFEIFLREILIPLNCLFKSDSSPYPTFKRLVSALEDAETKLRNAVDGSGSNGDFYDRLLARSCGLLREPGSNTTGDHPRSESDFDEANEWDLEYAPKEPVGTLFLDEFADLPLSTQTLLLRFLQDGEVQPMGFSGRILGMNVRIMVATSDSRVAEFAGERINDDLRTSEEKQPLRTDLLHRVRFQVIRTEPVTKDNVERILKGLISQKSNVLWHKRAVSYFVDEIIKIITPTSSQVGDAPTRLNRRASFGHRRELSRVVDLVWEYAQSVGARGVRDADLESVQGGKYLAKKGLIERLWSPSMIVSTDGAPVASTKSSVESDTSINQATVSEIRSRFLDALGGLPHPVKLPEQWRYKKDVYNNAELLNQGAEVHEIIRALFADETYQELEVLHALTCTGSPSSRTKIKDAESFKRDFSPKRVEERISKK